MFNLEQKAIPFRQLQKLNSQENLNKDGDQHNKPKKAKTSSKAHDNK